MLASLIRLHLFVGAVSGSLFQGLIGGPTRKGTARTDSFQEDARDGV